MKRELIKDVLKRTDFGEKVVLGGWIRTRRDSKRWIFIHRIK